MFKEELQTKVTFLGTSTAVPDVGSDTASFLINDRYLVDNGWSVVSNLRGIGVDPTQIDYLFFTHMHHDHYLSLPSLLFYFLMMEKPLQELKIVGPAEDVGHVVDLALAFLQKQRFYEERGFPEIIPLVPGQSYEDANFQIDTCATVHPVQGLCYRFTDKLSGSIFSFTGDTAPHEPIADHVRGSKLLIHEASWGPVAVDPADNKALHSGAVDAGRIAKAADVDKLILLHGQLSKAEACVEAAAKIFGKPVEWPKDGQTIWI